MVETQAVAVYSRGNGLGADAKVKEFAKRVEGFGLKIGALRSGGTVLEANLMLDRMSGRSRGFAFVTMSTDEEAQKVRRPGKTEARPTEAA